jgi:hypothetical protein
MGQVKVGGEQFETHIEADHRGQILQSGPDSGSIDAFGRQRFSEPFTLFDSMLCLSKRTELWNETTVASGSTNYLVNESSLELKTTTASGDTVLRRTKKRFPYQPGKSLMVMQSFVGNAPTAGLVQEVGYFDNNNGIMLRVDGADVQFVIRSSTTGSVQEEVVNKAQWNIDGFPELDISKAQIFVADMEWLGVGRVRCGFVIDGEIKYCHEFNHANNISKVYMKTAVLPLSYRIHNSSSIASPATLKQVCSSIISEGGYNPAGPIYTAGPALGSVGNVSSETLVVAIRMASGATDNLILPSQVDGGIEGNTIGKWRIRRGVTISGASWQAADNGRGNVEYTTAGTITVSGVTEFSSLIGGRSSSSFAAEEAIQLSLGTDANGASEVLALTIEATTATKGTALLGWRELV